MTDAPGERPAEAWRPAPRPDGGASGFFSQAGVRFGWSCALVPDIGHDNGGMAPYAIRLLRAGPLPTGGECVMQAQIPR